MADIESRLRQMVLELTKPTVQRTTLLQTDCHRFEEQLESQGQQLRALADHMHEAKTRGDMVVAFKEQLDQFWEQQRELELKLGQYQRETVQRVELVEKSCENSNSFCGRLGRTVDRSQQDIDSVVQDVMRLEAAMDMGIQKSKEQIEGEVRRMDISLREMKEMHQVFSDEVWGPEEPAELAPPSLRRLDMQAKRTSVQLGEALARLAELRRLDSEMTTVRSEQSTITVHLRGLTSSSTELRDRVEQIAQDTKQDTKRISNMMAAYTANLMQDVHAVFNSEVETLRGMQAEVEHFVRGTEGTVARLEEALQSTIHQVEAIIREVRVDVDGLELKRRRDKQALEDALQTLQGRVASSLEASEGTLKGIEHVSNVVGMSLQSERMSIALDAQDFAERREIAHVGVRKECERARSRGSRVRGGIDPEQLVRLSYQPQPVTYQGTCFERAQLLALREKLLHFAQEALAQGPSQRGGSAKQRHTRGGDGAPGLDGLPAPMVPSTLGICADVLCGGARTPPLTARPGSRGQPSARGSPLLENDFDRQVSRPRGEGSSGAHTPVEAARTPPPSLPPERHTAGSAGSPAEAGEGTGASGKHLPALVAAAAVVVGATVGNATPRSATARAGGFGALAMPR